MTQFQPGQSGNPAGKAKGTKNKTTKMQDKLRQMLFDGAPELIEIIMKQAKEGDHFSQKLWAERILPALQSIEFKGDLNLNVPQLQLGLTTEKPVKGIIIDQPAPEEEEEPVSRRH